MVISPPLTKAVCNAALFSSGVLCIENPFTIFPPLSYGMPMKINNSVTIINKIQGFVKNFTKKGRFAVYFRKTSSLTVLSVSVSLCLCT